MLCFVRGRLLIKDSTSPNNVVSMSSVSLAFLSTKPVKTFLMVRSMRSHTPPMWEALGGLKFHSMLHLTAYFWITSLSMDWMFFDISASAAVKFVPLSDHILQGVPLLEINQRKPFMNVSASKL